MSKNQKTKTSNSRISLLSIRGETTMNSIRKLALGPLYNNFTSTTSSCSKRGLNANVFSAIRQASSYEGDGKTSASILNMEQGLGLMINSFSPHGFRLNNEIFIKGPMAIFPNTALSWYVENIDDINEESLCIFPLLDPGVDIVVIGCGDAVDMTKERRDRIRNIMKKFKIPVEILPTESACTTFNFLVAENRFVGAALLPQKKGYDLRDEYPQKMVSEHGLLS